MSAPASAAPYRVTLPGDRALPDVLGVWETAADEGSFAVSATGAGSEPAVLWQITLPGDAGLARADLARQERRIASTDHALADIDRRLIAFNEQWRQQGESFAFDPAGLPPAERSLAAMLLGQSPTEPAAQDFGVRDVVAEAKRLLAEARDFVVHAGEMVRYAADVETVQEGATLARTRVRWHGDAENLGLVGLTTEEADLHCRALALALETRTRWVSTAGHFAASLVVMATGLVTGNPVLAVGGLWQFFKIVLKEWRE